MLTIVALTVGCAHVPDVRQEFVFQILDVETARQHGRRLNVFVKYRYHDELPSSEYPDYRVIRSAVLDFIEVRPSQPPLEYWEILNGDLVRHLYATFPLSAITCQIQVRPDPDHAFKEPGFHASVATIGDIAPLDYRGEPSTGR